MSDPQIAQEIERKFLLKDTPRNLRKMKSVQIEQGYIVQTETREVRLRRKSNVWTMTIKDGVGLQRGETEVELSKAQARKLWPMTLGRRIAKRRFLYPYEGHTLEIDLFKGDLDGLRLCEVEFKSVKEAESFKAPDFLGEDVTDQSKYKNANLATTAHINGSVKKERFGCIPYLEREDTLYLVLVTNQSGTKWIFPKGQAEPDMSDSEVAMMESYEEAGVIGNLVTGLQVHCTSSSGALQHLYPMKVAQLLQEWPEDSIRERQVVKFKKAMQLIDDEALVKCVKELEVKLKG